MTVRSIAILGAGHGGLAAVADLAHRGYEVRLHARDFRRLEALQAAGGIEARGIVQGRFPIPLMTTDIAKVVNGADLIMLVVPSIAHGYYARALAPLLDGTQPVFLNPGHTGGGLHFVHELRKAGYLGHVKTCETVSLTYVARLEAPATVGVYGRIDRLGFSTLPGVYGDDLFTLLQPVYPQIRKLTNVIEAALSNMNAVFHPPGMLMNAGWIEHTAGSFLFYRDGITQSVGRVTAAIDAERMAIAAALQVPSETFLTWFHNAGLTTLAARDAGDISRACKESGPNATIAAPGSLDHRYIHEDIGCGLVPMADLGRMAGVATPTMDTMIQLAGLSLGIDYHRDGLTLDDLGLAGCPKSAIAAFVHDDPCPQAPLN